MCKILNMKKFYTTLIVILTFSSTLEPIFSREVHRNKRDVGTIVSIIAELGPPIYEIIRSNLKKKKCGKKIDSGMVNNYYNNNMGNAQHLKDAVMSSMPEAGNAIHMKASGYQCDTSYCTEMGANVKGTLGICSKQYCVCTNGEATMQTCGFWKVYDPMTNQCAMTRNAILCH